MFEQSFFPKMKKVEEAQFNLTDFDEMKMYHLNFYESEFFCRPPISNQFDKIPFQKIARSKIAHDIRIENEAVNRSKQKQASVKIKETKNFCCTSFEHK